MPKSREAINARARELRRLNPEKYRAHVRKYQKKYRVANREKIREYNRRWYRANRERATASRDAYRKRNADRVRELSRCRRYGLWPEDVERMIAEQGGVCALCRIDKPTAIDHCHRTGKVRGMLCRRCNIGLGHLRDDCALLQKAIEYVQRHPSPGA